MTKLQEPEIKSFVKEFLEKIISKDEIKKLEIEESVVNLEIHSQDPELLIGKHGKTISSLQHILGKILRKRFQRNDIFVEIDINNYKKEKIKHLKEMAKEAADKVSLEKKEKVLPPMSSYERRIVHLALSEREDVQTESVGEEPERRVVIKPAT